MNDSMEYWIKQAQDADFWFDFYFFRQVPDWSQKMDAILTQKREAYANMLRITKAAMELPTNE